MPYLRFDDTTPAYRLDGAGAEQLDMEMRLVVGVASAVLYVMKELPNAIVVDRETLVSDERVLKFLESNGDLDRLKGVLEC